MDNERSDQPERVRLPGFDPRDERYGQPDWERYGTGRWERYEPRDYGVRRTSRVSSWTAAALVAGVAVTTGYLAHNVPATSSTAKTTTKGNSGSTHAKPGKAGAVVPAAPVVHSPVVTSGGSGAAAGSRGGGGDN
jgi:hypothetical protein